MSKNVDKPCLICVNADFTNTATAVFCGPTSWFCFDCVCCELVGPYGERESRREQIMHDPIKGTYHIDGGESSSACTKYQMRDDHLLKHSPNIEAMDKVGNEATKPQPQPQPQPKKWTPIPNKSPSSLIRDGGLESVCFIIRINKDVKLNYSQYANNVRRYISSVGQNITTNLNPKDVVVTDFIKIGTELFRQARIMTCVGKEIYEDRNNDRNYPIRISASLLQHDQELLKTTNVLHWACLRKMDEQTAYKVIIQGVKVAFYMHEQASALENAAVKRSLAVLARAKQWRQSIGTNLETVHDAQ